MNLMAVQKLHYREGTSDKVFVSAVVELGTQTLHKRWWGRVGHPLKGMDTALTRNPWTQHNQLVREKTRKGYRVAEGSVVDWIDQQLAPQFTQLQAQVMQVTQGRAVATPAEPEPTSSSLRKFSFK